MVDDDLNMVALPETRNIKSIVTAEDRLCIERKNKQAVQGLLYVRFICFGNGNLVAAHDDSDGFNRKDSRFIYQKQHICDMQSNECCQRYKRWIAMA